MFSLSLNFPKFAAAGTQWAVALATLLLIAVGFAFVGTPADVPSTSQQTSAVKCNPQMPQFRPGRAIRALKGMGMAPCLAELSE
jgi:hypothetical protein